MRNASFRSMIGLVLFGSLPLTAPAQSRNPSGVRTSLRDTDPIDAGTVVSHGPDAITVKNNLFTRVFRINAETEIRRVDSSQLQVGDRVVIRCHVDDQGISTADVIEANADRWEGTITKVIKDAVCIEFDGPRHGSSRVNFDSNTGFLYCAGDDPERHCTIDDLKVGRRLETTGFILGNGELRAIRVLSIQKR